jgi:eukaryotic-like serine/threonine-protein kinase
VPEVWIPTDPDLTQPAPRPSPLTVPRVADASSPAAPRRSRRVLAAVAGLLVLAVGGAAGFLAFPRAQPTVTLTDGTLTVAVPRDWSDHVDTGTWTPPHADSDFLAISAGGTAGWNAEGSTAPGVFVGLMPGQEIPEQMPGHPECGPPAEPNETTLADGDDAVTVAYSDCPGDAVTIERVVQVSKSQLLWIQVRSKDQGTANRVLDAVRISGM